MHKSQRLQDLLPLLACPECQEPGGLSIETVSAQQAEEWQTVLREQARPEQQIICGSCHRAYPVTIDGIPVLWSHMLEQTFDHLEEDVNGVNPSEQDVKAANIQVYDQISDAYDSEGVHADEVTRSRLVSAFVEATNTRQGTHLDVGCGAGNVLQFFSDVLEGPKIGMDVSLTGLRAVRRKGFHAVLGDAEKLPFPNSSLGLVTASSVLHHLFLPDRLMQQAHRTLSTGGVFLTDFDPNARAAEWGWLALQLYALRRPVYHLLSLGRRRVFHGTEQVQVWNAVAEFHNKPGEGFDIGNLRSALVRAGFELHRVFPHNCHDSSVSSGSFVQPSPRHLLVQALSGRNPFHRDNSDTLLTASVKPVSVHNDEISPSGRRQVQELFAESHSGLQESSKPHQPQGGRIIRAA
ncbi:MAG: methyltransferase domain-containing protein [Planctomycetaceae bacterium]|nr:methyltransferase domain-containing protein [Planctomycetaceae bacterium]